MLTKIFWSIAIESIEDLRHIRADLFTIMSTKGDDGHQECSDIIEKAIQVKVKIIQRSKKNRRKGH